MAQGRASKGAAKAFRVVMGLGLLLTLAANIPGQMSLDSVVALTEARTGVRQTWAPPMASWLLKPFDGLVAGTGLYVAASCAVLFFSLMSLSRLRSRTSWWAVALGALLVLTPQILIYQGIVWRDVLFANLSLAGFVMLAHAGPSAADRQPFAPLLGALVCLTMAALVRQNGAVLLLAAAGVMAWRVRAAGWKAMVGWGLGSLAAAAALAFILNPLATPTRVKPGLRPGAEALILEHYDIVGAKAHVRRLKLKEIAKVDPAAASRLETEAAKVYSASRVDTLDYDPAYGRTLWHLPDAVMHAQWRRIITHYPAAYLVHRADVFRWTFLTPRLEMCLPVTVGVSGPEGLLRDLNVQTGIDPKDQGLAAYALRFYGTPVLSHLTWALVSMVVIVWLLRRRDPADLAIVGLQAGVLAFTASFFLIGVACDYRYLYPLDLAAMAGLIYLALDPPGWRRAKAP